jgi:trimeric autotransporter adhesin
LYSACPTGSPAPETSNFLMCGTTTITSSSLTTGVTYYIRVSESWSSIATNGGFTLCVTHPIVASTNNTCATAIGLTSGAANCNAITANLFNANITTPNGPAGVCATSNPYDVWFSFSAIATSQTVKVSNLGSSLTSANTYVEVFSGTCGALVSLGCQQVSSSLLGVNNLTIGSNYYVRVFTKTNPNTGTQASWNFDICVSAQPVNDECAGAILVSSTLVNCTAPTSGTLNYATMSMAQETTTGCIQWASGFDVWYRFVAVSSTQTISISLEPTNTFIQCLLSCRCKSYIWQRCFYSMWYNFNYSYRFNTRQYLLCSSI